MGKAPTFDEAIDDPPTFDLEVTDAAPSDLACILGGIGYTAMDAARHNAPGRAKQASALARRIMMENPEASRWLILHTDYTELHGFGDDAEFLDALDLHITDGEFVDARDMTDIEVE